MRVLNNNTFCVEHMHIPRFKSLYIIIRLSHIKHTVNDFHSKEKSKKPFLFFRVIQLQAVGIGFSSHRSLDRIVYYYFKSDKKYKLLHSNKNDFEQCIISKIRYFQ